MAKGVWPSGGPVEASIAVTQREQRAGALSPQQRIPYSKVVLLELTATSQVLGLEQDV